MTTIYELLRCSKGTTYAGEQISSQSHLKLTPEIDKPAGALRGISRAHGHATPEVQDRVIDILLEIGARYKLSYRDIAHLLLICKIESGFNPDAAAGTTSAAGLGQYTSATIEEAAKAGMSKVRLGFCLNLAGSAVFDAEHGAFGVLLSYMKSKERAIKYFGNDYEQNLYLFHHDGWYFKPTPEKLAESGPKDALQIIQQSILPSLDRLEGLLSARCGVSFNLLAKDGEACSGQAFVAIYPSKPTAPGLLSKVQATAQKAEVVFGVTDSNGATPRISAPALSEIVFVILNRRYKDLLTVDACLGVESAVELDDDLPSKIAFDAAVTPTGQRKITHIANGSQVPADHSLQAYSGEFLRRRPPMEFVAAHLRLALNMAINAGPALVEHKRSHIVLPSGNRAQTHGGSDDVIAIRTGTSIEEIAEREKMTDVPHATAETKIKKKVEVASPKKDTVLAEGLLFPLAQRPSESYRTGARAFNSSRSGRRHAGCDLYAAAGTEVRAISDGTIIQCYDFYWGTDAIEINHGHFIARYGEIAPRGKKERAALGGTGVKRGEVIGKVGQLINGNGEAHKNNMLHFELYSTTASPLDPKGALSNKDSMPFQRRADLCDPSGTLDMCKLD